MEGGHFTISLLFYVTKFGMSEYQEKAIFNMGSCKNEKIPCTRIIQFLHKEVEEQFQHPLIHQVLIAAVIIRHYTYGHTD